MIRGVKISSVMGLFSRYLVACGAPSNGRPLPHGDDQTVMADRRKVGDLRQDLVAFGIPVMPCSFFCGGVKSPVVECFSLFTHPD